MDLSAASEGNIIKTFNDQKGSPICARFHHSQFGRHSSPVQTHNSFPFLQKIAATFLLFQGVVNGSLAQSKGTKINSHYLSPAVNAKQNDSTITIKGCVVDHATGKSIANVPIGLLTLNLKTRSNQLGEFEFSIPKNVQSIHIYADLYNDSSEKYHITYSFLDLVLDVNTSKAVTLYGYRTEQLYPIELTGHPPPPPDHFTGVVAYVPPRLSRWQKFKAGVKNTFSRK